jgi:RimJ/RimL family protein N-acetyltransferase
MLTTFREISLRPVCEDDLPFLFRLFADPGRCHLWMQGRRVFDEREFHQAWAAWTADMMAAKFIVARGEQPIGLVFDYSRTLEDGTTKVTALLQEKKVGHGGGVIATALLIDWLLQSVPLRKVYLEVYAYNPRVVRMLRKVGLAEEGVLKGNRFWNGAYWDLHMFALYREAWPDVRARILRPSSANGIADGRAMRAPRPCAAANGCFSGTE